jgi:hypothetical protein
MKQLPALDQRLSIAWPHLDASGKPLATFENIQFVIDAYSVTIARPLLNADDFTPFFGERYVASSENQRDCHRAQLRAICERNELHVRLEQVERYVQLRGLEIEDQERRAANAKRLRAGGAL